MEREVRIGIINAQESTPKSKEDKFKNTLAFLEAAIAEGAHLKIPFYVFGRGKVTGQISQEAWYRQKNIVGVYFGSPATLEDVGRTYGITREMVRLVKGKGIRNIWKNCSLETQTLFPFQEIALGKPLSQKSKERYSQAKGGNSTLVNRELEAGKSIGEIRKEKGLSIQQIVTSRYVLRGWGTAVPFLVTPHSENLELENKLRNAKTDKEKQELLNQVKRKFYSDHVKGESPLLTTLRNIALEAGLNLGFRNQNVPFFIECLKNVGFPMREIPQKIESKIGEEKIQTYRFVLAKDKERAKQILLADPNLQRFRRS